jgi:hypothetical protein
MTEQLNTRSSFRERAAAELQEFAILAGYLYVSFTAIAFFKASILHAEGVTFSPWIFAAIKAAVTAKFMLIGHALKIGEGFKMSPLVVPTLYKSVTFFLLVAVLTVIEEVSIGVIHGRSIAQSTVEIAGGKLDQTFAVSFVMLLIFIPYFAFRSLGDVIGDRTLVRLYFEPRGPR